MADSNTISNGIGGAAALAAGVNPWLVGASVAAPILGGLLGESQSEEDRAAARAQIEQAYAELASLGLPPDLSAQIIYEKYKSAGEMTPQLEKDLGDLHTKYTSIQGNTEYRQMQENALQRYKDLARTGMSMEDRLALQDIRDKQLADLRGSRQAVQQEMQSRGMGGAGADIAARLGQVESAQDRSSRENMQVMAQAGQKALQALGQQAGLAGQMSQEDWNRQEAAARAEDAMNMFNLQNSMARQQRNAAVLNQAQLTNLQNLQNIANMNTQQQNQELLRTKLEPGQRYAQTLQYKTALANARLGQASNLQNQADRTAQKWAGIGSGIGQGLQSYNNYQAMANLYGGREPASEASLMGSYKYGGMGQNPYDTTPEEYKPKNIYSNYGYLNNIYNK